MKAYFVHFTAILSLVTTIPAYTKVEFEIPTIDRKTTLTGQIDFPSSKTNSSIYPLAVLVPGTGIFDRDADFGISGTKDDFIFQSLSKRLNAAGFAVLRYDYRGISCNMKTVTPCESCEDPKAIRKHFADNCIDNSVRATVTPQNIRDDIESIFQYGANHPSINRDSIVAFGHSEGSLNLSHLIHQNRIFPKGLIFMGGLAESPASVIRWQMTDRVFTEMFSFDKNQDGFLTNDEIRKGHSTSFLKAIPIKDLFSKRGKWTKFELKNKFEEDYEKTKLDAIKQPDSKPFPGGMITQASYKWWKMFFTDWRNVIENLSKFEGPIHYHNGNNDSQTNFERQSRLIKSVEHQFNVKPKVFKHQGRGHSLSHDAIFGPIPKDSLDMLVNSFREIIAIKQPNPSL